MVGRLATKSRPSGEMGCWRESYQGEQSWRVDHELEAMALAPDGDGCKRNARFPEVRKEDHGWHSSRGKWERGLSELTVSKGSAPHPTSMLRVRHRLQGDDGASTYPTSCARYSWRCSVGCARHRSQLILYIDRAAGILACVDDGKCHYRLHHMRPLGC